MCRACSSSDDAALRCAERLSPYLRGLPLFRDLDAARIERLVRQARTLRLRDGQWLFRLGDPADRLYVVRSGQVALFRQSPDGRDSVFALVDQDQVFGEELALAVDGGRRGDGGRGDHGGRRDFNARAVGAATVLALDRREFGALLDDCPQLLRALLLTAHRRQVMLLDHIERLALHDASTRLLAYLRHKAAETANHQRVRLDLPKHTLAAHLAIQPETLSRTLARLKSDGVLREQDGTLVLATADPPHCAHCPALCWGCPGQGNLPPRPAARNAITLRTPR